MTKRLLPRTCCGLLLALSMHAALPAQETLDAQAMAIARELRCLVCQNQSLAESHAGLALDLRAQIEEQLRQGRSRQQVLDYMTERYGEFILYRPAFNWHTALLWLGPGLLLALGLSLFVMRLRRAVLPPAEAEMLRGDVNPHLAQDRARAAALLNGQVAGSGNPADSSPLP